MADDKSFEDKPFNEVTGDIQLKDWLRQAGEADGSMVIVVRVNKQGDRNDVKFNRKTFNFPSDRNLYNDATSDILEDLAILMYRCGVANVWPMDQVWQRSTPEQIEKHIKDKEERQNLKEQNKINRKEESNGGIVLPIKGGRVVTPRK